jgi:serine protease Do
MNAPPRARLAALALAATALVGVAALADPLPPQPGAIQPVMPNATLPDFAHLVHQVKPAVVSITSKIRGDDAEGPQMGGGNGQMPFPFPFPFGFQAPQQRRSMEARGSGFIIDPDGVIVTNNHVVKGATSVSVTLDDGTVLPARIVGRDPRTDVAVLRVKSNKRLPFINLGDSSKVEPGQWVIAVGNPFGLGGSVTAGIVSARGRDIGEGPYDSFIQVDAPINQGNSGGPLFAQDGTVVGVNTAIISPSGGSVGIGFAIPSNTVKSVVAQLQKSGHVTRGYIGVSAQAVSASMAQALKLKGTNAEENGALVASVEPDSPAASAGLQPGDVIQAVNSETVTNARDLARDIAEVPPGGHAKLAIVRDGKPQTVDVTVGTLSADVAANGRNGGFSGNAGVGLTLSPLTPQLRNQLDLPDRARGAVITEVRPGSPAEAAGLQPGDVITGVGDRLVTSPSDASRAIRSSIGSGDAVALRILRNGQSSFVAVTPDKADGNQDDDSDNG